MKVKDILEHFLSRADWVNREHTVDRVIAGDPELDVDRCMVTWMPGAAQIKAAAAKGVKLLVCHEPTFWDHGNDRPDDKPHAQDKLALIRKLDVTILRNHDCWDKWPNVGIPWAWGKFLGLEGQPVTYGHDGYQHRYDIEPLPFGDFARSVARRTATIGEPAVRVTGDLAKLVSRIGVGTGCGCIVYEYEKMGCDCWVVCDDGAPSWASVQYARDRGVPVISVNHGTSEEPGMMSLTRYINENIPGLKAELIPHGNMFQIVR